MCAGGPLLLRTASLAGLDPALPRDLALLDLGLRTRHAGLQLACPGSTQYLLRSVSALSNTPDMMFHTRRSLARTLDTAARADWRRLATKHQFQETLLPPPLSHVCVVHVDDKDHRNY